jgi:glycosyltransferase involved in cell wall biosynthesis
MRYIWDQRSEYLDQLPGVPGLRGLIHYLSKNLRLWDMVSTGRCDSIVVNSSFVGSRVRKYYGRSSTVIHPPIANDFFVPPPSTCEQHDYWLAAGAMVSYKRFDLAIAACERLGQPLIIAGSGPEEKKLRKLAGPHTKFHISPDQGQMRSLLQGARGLLFPGVEDFGMIAIEAMACGTPVLALQAGGALDYIKPGLTGAFFAEARVDSLMEAMQRFRPETYAAKQLAGFAANFSKKNFQDHIKTAIDEMFR